MSKKKEVFILDKRANIYITEQGASIKKRSETIIVEKDDKQLLEIECFKVDSILVFGNVQFSTQTLKALFEHGIELAIFSYSGKYLGRLFGSYSKNAPLRLKQHELLSDETFRLKFSREILSAKIENSLTMIDRSLEARKMDQDESLENLMKRWLAKVSIADSQDSLLGLEGSFAREYFERFGRLINKPFEWHGRKMHPSPDPVNALLSLTYVFVTNRLHSQLEGIGLDPYMGFFHVVDYSRPSLAIDMIEVLRAPLCDRFVLTLLSRRIFKPDDFENDKSGGVRLLHKGFRKYIGRFEQEMQRSIKAGELDTTFNDIIRDSVRNCEDFIMNCGNVKFFRMPLR